MACNLVNCSEVFPKCQFSVGLVVASNFFKTVAWAFNSEHEIHLKSILGSCKLNFINWLSKTVELFEGNLQEISWVWSCTFNGNTEKTWICEVAVNSRDTVEEAISLNSLVSTAWSWSECLSTSQKLVDKVESSDVVVTPWNWLECELDAGCWWFCPCSIFATNVFRSLADIVVLWDC